MCIPACPGGCLPRGGVCPGGCLSEGCLPRGCLPRGVSVQGGVCPGEGVVCPGGCPPPPPVNRITNGCENITLPQHVADGN